MPAKKSARSRKTASPAAAELTTFPTEPTIVFSAIAVWALHMATWASKVEDSYELGCGTPEAALELTALCEGFQIWSGIARDWADGIENCYRDRTSAQHLMGHDQPPPPPF